MGVNLIQKTSFVN